MRNRWLTSLLMTVALMLSYSGVMAFESPPGFTDALTYTPVDFICTERITPDTQEATIVASVSNNLTLRTSLTTPYKGFNSGAYVTYKLPDPVTSFNTKPQRGYTKVLFS